MKFKTMFAIGGMAMAMVFAFMFVQCSKDGNIPAAASATQPIDSRDGADDGMATSNFAVIYKLDGQTATEQVFNGLPETAFKHYVVSPALSGEAADLLHVEAVAFSTRGGYEDWGDTKGYKIRQSLKVEDRLKFVADSLGLTETSVVPQSYIDYANNVAIAELDPPSPCYLGNTLWKYAGANGFFEFTPSTAPFRSLGASPLYHEASSCKFHRLTTCGTTTGHMRAWKWAIPVKKIMTISVIAGIPAFNFVNIFAPLNDKIGCFTHWGTF